MDIGIAIFDQHKNFCIGYSNKNGFFKTKNFENITQSASIWFTNLTFVETLVFQSYTIKSNEFFNFNFDFIVNYYGYKNASTKDKIALLYKSINNIIDYYSSKNPKLEEIVKDKCFFHEVFSFTINKKEIKDFNISPNFFWDHDYWFTNIKENYGVVSVYNNKANYISEINNLDIPYGNFYKETITLKHDKDVVSFISNLRKENKVFYAKIIIKNIPDIYKVIFKKNIFDNAYWIPSIELEFFINNGISFECYDFLIFESKRRIKELTKKELKPISHKNLNNFIYSSSYLNSLFKNNINAINNFIYSYERTYWYPIVIDFLENDIPVLSYGDFQTNISFEYEQTKKFLEICEKYNLVYPISILRNNQ